jgi:chitodextrinase
MGNGMKGIEVRLNSIENGSHDFVDNTFTSGDGDFEITHDIPDGKYELLAIWGANDNNAIRNVPGDILTDIEILIKGYTMPTPTPKPAPTSSTPTYQTNSQVKYAKATYNMFPVIQINMSWKRASKFEPIEFDAGSTYDPDGYIVDYEWDFGDGSMAAGHAVEHAYRDMGRYTIKLRVIDNSGAERSAYMTAIISNKPPISLPGNDTIVTVGEKLALDGSASYDPDGKVVKYEWSFGDGTTGEGAKASHSYDRPDKYKVELKVTDDSGSNSTASMAVNVAGISVSTTPAPTSGGSSGIALLAGAGVACVALMILMRKKGK